MQASTPINGILAHASYRRAVNRGAINPALWRWAPIGYVRHDVWEGYWAARWPADPLPVHAPVEHPLPAKACPSCGAPVNRTRATYCRDTHRASFLAHYRSY